MGSDPTAASGGCREGSEWQRSHCKERLTQATHRAGTATGIVSCRRLDGDCKDQNKKHLTNSKMQCIIHKLSKAAAIAQPVERILGKDEVASSNLASSSNKTPKPSGFGVFCCGKI